MARKLYANRESWTAKTPFRINDHVWNAFDAVSCVIRDGDLVGRGEGHPVYYLGESVDSLLDDIRRLRAAVEAGASRSELLTLMPPGGARNAIDAALWDLESQHGRFSVWDAIAGSSDPIQTVFTIGLEAEPHAMAAKALAAKDLSLFKVKLDADRPVERVRAIRDARPDASLVIDANQAWTFEQLADVAPQLAELGVSMIEQPLPRGQDTALDNFEPPLPLCADESCLHLDELQQNASRYQMINIKLDKTGGLTHALQLADAAEQLGLRLMVGCMGGTSIAMAPAHVIAQRCDIVDIDGPLLIEQDPLDGLVYTGNRVSLPERPFWGMPR